MFFRNYGKPWKQQYYVNNEQFVNINGWTKRESLPKPIVGSQAIITKNRIYLLGGRDRIFLSTVYTASISDDGTLGSWTTVPSLPITLADSQAIVTKNRVYLLGGYSYRAGVVSTVYTAFMNADETLGKWTIAPSLPEALSNSQVIVTKNRVYLLGGCDNFKILSKVYTASINEDGTLGSWATAPSLPEALSNSQAITIKNRVYILGGLSEKGAISTVYTAFINEDGTLSTWTKATPLPEALCNSQAIIIKNRVYILGGLNVKGAISTVYTAFINEDGVLNSWATAPSLPEALSNSQAIVTKNKVYLLGGHNHIRNVSTVYEALISD